MGLDVFFYHTHHKFTGDPENHEDLSKFREMLDAETEANNRERIQKLLEPLREAWERMQTNNYWRNIYNLRYFNFIHEYKQVIAPNGDDNDFYLYPYVETVLDLPVLEEKIESEYIWKYKQNDAYFRKVNFLFAYFQDKGKLIDEYYAFVDREDVEDIISRCEQVLENHELAEELLPTQSGFFFGSTEYDEYYFEDVKDCLNKMSYFLNLYDLDFDPRDGEDSYGTGFVIFSW